ncbi:MAG: PIG-L family deacetylase [Dehalococcoidales bacterium]|nr:PIG-L family deacetylase [Dehalococcoidales bacterium]
MRESPVYMMAFSPHPVDTEWGIAGTVASLTRQGKEVVYVIATNGNTGSMDPKIKPQDLADIREGEQLAAARVLGVKEVIFLRHQDLGLEYTLDFRKEIIRLILGYRPQVVATCDPYQRYMANPDHRVLGQIVMDSVWPVALSPNTYPDLLAEGYQLHKVKEVWLWATQEPNFQYDISDTFNIKMNAFACHKTQQGEPFSEFLKMFSERAIASAKGTGYKMAESFHRLEVLQRL